MEKMTTEELKDELKKAEKWLKNSRSSVRKKGGWMAWNGDAEERVEEYADKLLAEIRVRQRI